MYTVFYQNVSDYSGNLHDCLRYVGKSVNGRYFGCLLITAKQAYDAGYTIQQR